MSNLGLVMSNLGHVKPWSCLTLIMSNLDHVKPWSCLTLIMSNLGHVKPWTCQTLVMSNLGHIKPRSCQTKDYDIGIYCFSTKHTVLISKSNGWLAQSQDNVSEWGYMSTYGLLFQLASIIKIQLSVLVKFKANFIS